MLSQIRCPNCDMSLPQSIPKCFNCGHLFKADEDNSNSWRESAKISKEALIALSAGFFMAAILVWGNFEFLRFIIRHFTILVHEFGHAIFGWLSGFFSIPAFDFSHGGGVTMTMGEEPNKGILFFVAIFFGWLIYTFRNFKLILSLLILMAIFFILVYLKEWHSLLIVYGGHATVAIMSGIFIFRGLSNVSVHHFIERILYFFLAFFILLDEIQFTHRLKNDLSARSDYLEGKGGMMNDFHVISEDMNISLNAAVNFHLFFCLLVPIGAYAAYLIAMKLYSKETH